MRPRIISMAVAVALVGPGLVWAQPGEIQKKKVPPEKVLQAQQQIAEQLKALNAAHGQVIWIDAPAVNKAFPKATFFAVRFRQFPVARVLPEGFGASNVFVVKDGGKPQRLADVKALQKFFHDDRGRVKGHEEAKDALVTWLSIAPEYLQDGFYAFEILDKEITAEEAKNVETGISTYTVAGRAMVTRGGNGQINTTLVFGDQGRLSDVKQDVKIRPGPRPICQATKLLDPDPIVRRMAEQDLFIMGLAARDYLMEQWGRANPELRQAIDRLWQRIRAQE
jgi:hypothetical protein